MSPAATGSAPAIVAGTTIAGHDPAGLVATYGSPLYVYDRSVLRARAAALRTALPRSVGIAYATKANGSPLVLGAFRAEGLGADVSSGGELRAALRAGFDARDVVYTGPGKTDAELEAALHVGVGALTIESLDELEAVIARAQRARPGQGLMLRLATARADEDVAIISASGNVKFGLTDDEAEKAIDRLRASAVMAPHGPLVLRGFHAFGASNVLDPSALVAAVAALAGRAERIATRHALELELLDAGGGLGIAYGGEPDLDLAALGEGLRAELESWATRSTLRTARLLLEPGRWLVGPAGVYVCRVVRTKPRGDRLVAIADGGIHHLLRPRLVGQDHRVVAIGELAGRESDTSVDLVGPLCTGLDVLASAVAAPRPGAGDLFAVLDAGAYGYSESMPLFLSHPTPAEVVIDGDAVFVSRARVEPT